MAPPCSHVDRIEIVPPEEVAGCEECLRTGGRWVHLRACLTCGKVGCCDSSPNRHARQHAAECDHPVIVSAQPNEDWCWCFVDEVMFRVDFGAADAS
jgi:uncharacterized UBP type Zn finger protein